MSAIREIFASFGFEFDSSQLEKGKKETEGFIDKLQKVGEAVAVAFAYEKVKEFVFGLAESAEHLELQAIALGTSSQALQEWQYAANMVGVNADQLTMSMTRLEKAASGDKKGSQLLGELGIKAKDASGEMKPVTMLMDEVAEGISKIEDPSKRTKIAMGLFGKQGAKLIPLFSQGQEGIKKYREEVAELGGGITEDFIKKSKDMVQGSKRLNFAWTSLKVNIVGSLIPGISKLLGSLTKYVVWIMKSVDVATAFKSATALLAIGGIMKLSNAIGPLNAKLAGTLLRVLPLIIAFLAIDDAMHFLAGDDSLIGRFLDSAFGAGSAAKVRSFFTDIDAAARASVDPNAGVGINILATGALMTAVAGQATQSWESFYRVLNGGWLGFMLAIDIAMVEIGGRWAALGAAMQDFFVGIYNVVISGLAAVGDGFDQILDLVGSTSSNGRTVGGGIRSLKGDTNASANNDAYNARVKQQLADEYDKIAADLDPKTHTIGALAAAADRKASENGTASTRVADVTSTTTVTVTVPTGTPAEQAKAVGAAAAAGADKGLRDAHAALSPGGPRT